MIPKRKGNRARHITFSGDDFFRRRYGFNHMLDQKKKNEEYEQTRRYTNDMNEYQKEMLGYSLPKYGEPEPTYEAKQVNYGFPNVNVLKDKEGD